MFAQFAQNLDKLVNDARGKQDVIIAGTFSAWTHERLGPYEHMGP